MQEDELLDKRLSQLNTEHRRKKWWHNLVSVMSVIVVFCTTYSLIMNAITLEVSPDPDTSIFTVNGAEIPGTFTWTDANSVLEVTADLHGNASYVGTLPENTSPTMSLEFDKEEKERLSEQYGDDDASIPLMAFRIRLFAGDTELLLDDCKADISLKMKKDMFAAADTVSEGEETGEMPNSVTDGQFVSDSEEPSEKNESEDAELLGVSSAAQGISDDIQPHSEPMAEPSETESGEPNSEQESNLSSVSDISSEKPGSESLKSPDLEESDLNAAVPSDIVAVSNTAFKTDVSASDGITESETNEPLAKPESIEDARVMATESVTADTEVQGKQNTAGAETAEIVFDPEISEMLGKQPMALVATDGETELGTAELSASEDTVLIFSARAGETAGVVVQSNPRFTLQHYLDFPAVVTSYNSNASLKTGDTIPFLNTSYGEPRGVPTGEIRDGLVLPNELQSTGENGTHFREEFEAYLEEDGKLKINKELVRLFKDENTDYRDNPQINYMSRLYNGKNEGEYNYRYTLKQIWVYNPTEDEQNSSEYLTEEQINALTAENFKRYDVPLLNNDENKHNPDRIRFTNNPSNSHIGAGATEKYPYDKTILIKNNSIVRLVFDYTEGAGEDSTEVNADFFDYDISDGNIYSEAALTNPRDTATQNLSQTWFAYTYMQGINNPANYSGGNASNRLGFGLNVGMGYQNVNRGYMPLTNGEPNKDQPIKINGPNSKWQAGGSIPYIYKACSFGLVSGLTTVGKSVVPEFSDGIYAPDLFSAENVTGKTVYDNYKLGFYRQGGTYTLSYVKNEEINEIVVSNLRELKHPAAEYSHIFTNEFWPMDGSPSHGTNGHDLKFGTKTTNGTNVKNKRMCFGQGNPSSLPVVDLGGADKGGVDHNAFFGMSFSVDFEVEPGYCGPLAYWFYGDDDMWVFLEDRETGTSKLVADIGGIHSAAGEYVNLWEYIESVEFTAENPHKYSLRIFYTERGASGSTCYMRFSVPLTANTTPSPSRDDELLFEKIELDENGVQKEYDPVNGKKYDFELTMITPEGADYEDVYDYKIYSRSQTPDHTAEDAAAVEEGTIGTANPESGKYEFSLRNGEYIIITNLPDDTYYTIKEKRGTDDKFVTQYQKGQHRHVDGKAVNTLESAIRYDHTVGNPDKIDSQEYNYVLFINGPVIKTEVSPGDGKSVHIDEEIIYEIEWGNDTSDSADVFITDKLDDGLGGVDFVGAKFMPQATAETPADYENGWWNPADGVYSDSYGRTITYNKSSNTVVWILPNQAKEACGVVALKVKVNKNAIAEETEAGKFGTKTPRVVNRASVNIGGNEITTNVVENPVWGPFKTEPNPGDKAPVSRGDKITYTIAWKNYLNEQVEVTLRDPLDPEVSYVEGSANAYIGSYDDAEPIQISDAAITYDSDKREIKWNLGVRPPGEEGYIIFEVTVNASAGHNEVLNHGYVQVGNESEIETNYISNPIYGYSLPATGGAGTAAYMLGGALMSGGSAIVLLCRRRKKRSFKGSC